MCRVPGTFKLTKDKDDKETQSEELGNLKKHIKRHLKCKSHEEKIKILRQRNKSDEDLKGRQYKAGMNVFLERYQGIRQSKSRLNFEEDMLRAKMNGADVGDTNHSRIFAAKLDEAIYKEIKENMKENMGKELDATGKRRPAGLMMDKMTGQMHAVAITVPENPLSQVASVCFIWMKKYLKDNPVQNF